MTPIIKFPSRHRLYISASVRLLRKHNYYIKKYDHELRERGQNFLVVFKYFSNIEHERLKMFIMNFFYLQIYNYLHKNVTHNHFQNWEGVSAHLLRNLFGICIWDDIDISYNYLSKVIVISTIKNHNKLWPQCVITDSQWRPAVSFKAKISTILSLNTLIFSTLSWPYSLFYQSNINNPQDFKWPFIDYKWRKLYVSFSWNTVCFPSTNTSNTC